MEQWEYLAKTLELVENSLTKKVADKTFKPIDEDCDKENFDDECQECKMAVECYEVQI